jgi:hypothetical protein
MITSASIIPASRMRNPSGTSRLPGSREFANANSFASSSLLGATEAVEEAVDPTRWAAFRTNLATSQCSERLDFKLRVLNTFGNNRDGGNSLPGFRNSGL